MLGVIDRAGQLALDLDDPDALEERGAARGVSGRAATMLVMTDPDPWTGGSR